MNSSRLLKIKTLLKGKVSRRGQTSLFDFFAAVLVFIVTFVMFITLSDRAMRDSILASDFSDMVALGHTLTEAFVSSQGVPSDWQNNPASAQSIGFAINQNDLDSSKLNAFIAMNYSLSKTKMGIPPFVDYHFAVTDVNGSTLYESGVERQRPQTVLQFIRYAILNNSVVKLKLVLYE